MPIWWRSKTVAGALGQRVWVPLNMRRQHIANKCGGRNTRWPKAAHWNAYRWRHHPQTYESWHIRIYPYSAGLMLQLLNSAQFHNGSPSMRSHTHTHSLLVAAPNPTSRQHVNYVKRLNNVTHKLPCLNIRHEQVSLTTSWPHVEGVCV